jgi:regulator of sigma E protease
MALTVVFGVLVLGILVFAHELGHFIVAKRSHIIVDEFGLGFPPRLIKLGERNGTEYTINAIPFGGFCRMRGEDDPTEAGSFAAASKKARAATLFAGAGMNFLVAIILFSIVTASIGVPDLSKPGAVVQAVSPGSPAATAGLQPGDRIVAADGVTLATVTDLSQYTTAHAGHPVIYRIERPVAGGGVQTLDVTMTARVNPPPSQGALGIAIASASRPATLPEAVWSGLRSTGGVIYATFEVPAMLIRQRKPIGDAGFMGPLGITVVTGEVVRSAAGSASPLVGILQFMAFLSAALGITQLLPIPALDGGRLLFIAIEAIRRKRVAPAQEGMVHLIGFGLLLALIGVMTIHEIASLVTGTFPSIGLH